MHLESQEAMKQIDFDRALRDANNAKRESLRLAEQLLLANSRVESLEELYRNAIADREKWELKFRQLLAVLEDAREMAGNRDG
jgi:hypothetical protein